MAGKRKLALDVVAAAKKGKSEGPTKQRESELWGNGHARVAGVDEAGRGPLAGPVVAAACVVPENVWVEGIDDSMKIALEECREEIYDMLVNTPCIEYAVSIIEPRRFDQLNILQARAQSM